LDLDSITVEFEEPEIFTTEQLALILQNENIPIRDRTFIGFGGLAGMRESEIAGLLWTDFHPDFDYVKLQRQHYLGKIKPLKSKRGKKKKERTVPIIEDLKLLIKEWKLQCPHTLREWVFPGRFGSKPINVVTWIRNHYKPILKECDLPYRKFHSLRHSFDTMMHDMGVPTREIMQILGHKSAKMTLDVYDRESPQRLIEVTRQIKVLDTSFLRKSLRK
jgi:integrase